MEKKVDENGCPIDYDKEELSSAPYCPDKPCNFCHGNSSVVVGRNEDGSPRYQTGWDWCQSNSTCGATVDWDRVFGY